MTCIFIWNAGLTKSQADLKREKQTKKSSHIWVKFLKSEDKERTIYLHREQNETGIDFPVW